MIARFLALALVIMASLAALFGPADAAMPRQLGNMAGGVKTVDLSHGEVMTADQKLGSGVQASLTAAGSGQKVTVIVTMRDQADVRQVTDSDRRARKQHPRG